MVSSFNYSSLCFQGASKAIDSVAEKTTGAVDRFKKLMLSKDKKATILEMVAANEIDQGLMDLIAQNVLMAKEAKEDKKAEFMEKLRKACEKYMIVTEDSQPSIPSLMRTAKEGDANQQGLYDPSSAPKADPDALGILDPSSKKPDDDGDEPKKLILHP